MGAAHPTTSAAEFLAAALDALTADRWHEGDAAYAWLDRAGDVRLGTPPDQEVLAAAVTCVGTASRIGADCDANRSPVRSTLSVSCCSVALVVRHPDGRIDRSNCVEEGSTGAVLRGWAALRACGSCAGAVEAS